MTKMFGLFASTAATHADALEFFKPDRNNASVPLNPYGDGHSSNSPIIALGEAWAYHIGQYFTGLRYGNTSRCAGEQSICYGNGEIPGLNSHQLLWKILIPIYQQTILSGYQKDFFMIYWILRMKHY